MLWGWVEPGNLFYVEKYRNYLYSFPTQASSIQLIYIPSPYLNEFPDPTETNPTHCVKVFFLHYFISELISADCFLI
jgi:hypothetical protein